MPPEKSPPIHFHFLQTFSISDRRKLKSFIVEIFRREKTPVGEVNYIFCSDEYLLDINRQFLDHDYFTDIITFNLANRGEPISAEIYISVERIRDNARDLKISARMEMLRVMFHGVLHLCGYKDKSKEDIKRMRAKEDFYLNKFQVQV